MHRRGLLPHNVSRLPVNHPASTKHTDNRLTHTQMENAYRPAGSREFPRHRVMRTNKRTAFSIPANSAPALLAHSPTAQINAVSPALITQFARPPTREQARTATEIAKYSSTVPDGTRGRGGAPGAFSVRFDAVQNHARTCHTPPSNHHQSECRIDLIHALITCLSWAR